MTPEQFNSWKKQPETEAFMRCLKEWREERKELMAGAYLSKKEYRLEAGYCRAIKDILECAYEDLYPSEEDV